MSDRDHWVTTTFNSGSENEFTVTHPPGYRLLTMDHYYRLNDAAELISDLDRSPVGRHRGDVESQSPTGVSQGNPLLPPGTHVGHTINGQRIVVPERTNRAADWIEATDA